MFEGLLQPTHLILILAIALVVVGPSKLSGLGGSLGKSLKEFKEAVRDDEPAQAEQTSAKVETLVVSAQPINAPVADAAENHRA